MTEEIKEMLWKIKRQNTYNDIGYFKTPLSNDDADKLLNYITNLQKENEILRENAEHNDKVVDKAKWNEMIYKSRNEKAIEYNKKIVEKYLKEDDCEYCDGRYNAAKKNLDILQGGDE